MRIGLGRIRRLPFFSNSVNDSVACDPVKTRLSELEAAAKEPTNHKVWNQTL